jgi:hypothetical protein
LEACGGVEAAMTMARHHFSGLRAHAALVVALIIMTGLSHV